MEKRKCALVTGAGTGIGTGIAEVLAGAGYDVGVHYNSSRDKALAACTRMEKLGARALPLQADISTVEGIESLFRQYRQAFGGLDIFVNNSGITAHGRLLEMTEAQFDTVCQVNWKGAYFCVQNAAKLMVETGTRGSIVLISSNQQQMVYPGSSAYGSMKAALDKLCRHAALELAPHGIRVNVIAPGFTDSGAPRMGEQEPTYEVIPMRRWATPEEIGHVVLFFSAPYAMSITGATLMMDGGAALLPPLNFRRKPPEPVKE